MADYFESIITLVLRGEIILTFDDPFRRCHLTICIRHNKAPNTFLRRSSVPDG